VKICFPIRENNGIDSKILEHLGSAPILIVIDTETGASITFTNGDKYNGHLCVPYKTLRGMLIDAAVADLVCKKALDILTGNGVGVFVRPSETISGTLQLIRLGKISYVSPKVVSKEMAGECRYSYHCSSGSYLTGVPRDRSSGSVGGDLSRMRSKLLLTQGNLNLHIARVHPTCAGQPEPVAQVGDGECEISLNLCAIIKEPQLMNETMLLKELIRHEVFPALGCTEPTAVAYAASLASAELSCPPESLSIIVDPGVFKNGFAVTVPNTGGERGNLIAGALGAVIRRPALKMEILQGANPELLELARAMVREKRVSVTYDAGKKGLYIDVTVRSGEESCRAVLEGGHTNLVLLEKNGRIEFEKNSPSGDNGGADYREFLSALTLAGMLDTLDHLDQEDLSYLQSGIAMNLVIAEAGKELKKVGYYMADLVSKGLLVDDVLSSSKILTASASDARMSGLSYPVMSSGGSGNQGIVAILVPYNVGRRFSIDDKTIVRSIALSHLVNGYIKCFTGDLSPICGCAIAAGVGAASAIVYQQAGKDLDKITLAVNTLISDLGGMLCDGAKGGCALKVASSTDSAIRAAYMAINGHGISEKEGFVGRSAEETIRNLSKISELGMAQVDATMLQIMLAK
jgi:L-cysteine desulfidase/predicted Fe-Mo cluster-binding NifX family protein